MKTPKLSSCMDATCAHCGAIFCRHCEGNLCPECGKQFQARESSALPRHTSDFRRYSYLCCLLHIFSDAVREYIDTFIERLNKVVAVEKPSEKPATPATKPTKVAKPKPTKKVKPSKTTDWEGEVDDDLLCEIYTLFLKTEFQYGFTTIIHHKDRFFSFDDQAELLRDFFAKRKDEVFDTYTNCPSDKTMEEWDLESDFEVIEMKRNNINILKNEKIPHRIIDLKTKKIQNFKGKPIKAAKPKREPKQPKQKTGKAVTEFPLEIQFLKTYCGWDGKVKTKTQVYTLIKSLQKAIAEKRIRKTSEHAKDKGAEKPVRWK